jgi:hypothetical protein
MFFLSNVLAGFVAVLLSGVMLTETVTGHSADGKIVWLWARRPIDEVPKYVNTYPWKWIAQADHARVRAAIQARQACRYALRPALYGGKLWHVESLWLDYPSDDAPILGISRTYTGALDKLTKREREIVKAIPHFDNVRSAALLGVTVKSLRAAKSRLAKKLEINQAQLTAWCAAYADLA